MTVGRRIHNGLHAALLLLGLRISAIIQVDPSPTKIVEVKFLIGHTACKRIDHVTSVLQAVA